MKTLKLCLAFLLIFSLTISSCMGALAITNEEIEAKSVILIEAGSGKVLFEKNADEKTPPASVTKVMTMLLVMEAIDSGKIKLTDVVTVSEHAKSMGGSGIWLATGEKMTVHDLLKSVAVVSANDSSVALGELVAGSEGSFVELMNKRAKELKMNNTNFANASGLDDPKLLTTARDISLMSAELLTKHPKIKEYTTIWMDTLRDGKSGLVNTNRLVRFYDGCTGLKTGTTSGAGYCLSASAKRGNMEIIAVVMGATTSDIRFNTATKLLNYGFANWQTSKLEVPKSEKLNVKIIKGVKDNLIAGVTQPENLLIPKGREKDIEQRLSLSPDVLAPVEKGQTLGKVVLYLDGAIISEYAIISNEKVEKRNLFNSITTIIKNMLKMK